MRNRCPSVTRSGLLFRRLGTPAVGLTRNGAAWGVLNELPQIGAIRGGATATSKILVDSTDGFRKTTEFIFYKFLTAQLPYK